ncbi:hypothetical protein ACP4OV_024046 [Aristida adscensionis]
MADRQPARSLPPDWKSGLPSELLEAIVKHLPSSDDTAAFRSVCAPWRDVVPLARFAPRLMELHLDPESKRVVIYNVVEGRTVNLELPGVRGKMPCGSSCGWLALVDESAAVTLLNPFTQVSVALPPADEHVARASLSTRVSKAEDGGGQWLIHGDNSDGNDAPPTTVKLHEMRAVFFHEVVLSGPPDAQRGQCVAMAVLPCSTEVAYCCVGVDNAWKLADTNLECSVSAIVFCQGRFVAIDYVGNISIFSSIVSGVAPTATPMPSLSPPAEVHRRSYLELDAELHLVGALVNVSDDTQHYAYGVVVYRCNILEQMPEWYRVHDAGDRTLLLSPQFSSSCFGWPSMSEYKSNTVYYSEPLYRDKEDVHHRLEIVNISDGTSVLSEAFGVKKMQGSDAMFWIRPRSYVVHK